MRCSVCRSNINRRRIGVFCSLTLGTRSMSRTGPSCFGRSGTSGLREPGLFLIVTNTGLHSYSEGTRGQAPSCSAKKASPRASLLNPVSGTANYLPVFAGVRNTGRNLPEFRFRVRKFRLFGSGIFPGIGIVPELLPDFFAAHTVPVCGSVER